MIEPSRLGSEERIEAPVDEGMACAVARFMRDKCDQRCGPAQATWWQQVISRRYQCTRPDLLDPSGQVHFSDLSRWGKVRWSWMYIYIHSTVTFILTCIYIQGPICRGVVGVEPPRFFFDPLTSSLWPTPGGRLDPLKFTIHSHRMMIPLWPKINLSDISWYRDIGRYRNQADSFRG